jgi:TonB family C-terminal domain
MNRHVMAGETLFKYCATILLGLLFPFGLFAQQGEKPSAATDNAAKDMIYTQVDRKAIFPGGRSGWEAFFAKNHRYPQVAKQSGLQTAVIARFVVRKDGSVSDPEIICSSHPLFTDEVLRLLKVMPKWKPAIKDGKPCDSYYKLPFIFELKETPVDWALKQWK